MDKKNWYSYTMKNITKNEQHTGRERRKLYHKKIEQNFNTLLRELTSLYRIKRNVEWVELNPPIRKGYEKNIVPRDDYSRRKDCQYFIELAKVVNKKVFHHDKTFIQYNYQTRKKEEVHAEVRKLHPHEYAILSKKMKAEFYPVEVLTFYWGTRVLYVLHDQWRFVEKISKHYIYQVRVVKSDVEKRIDEVEKILNSTPYINRNRNGWNKKRDWEDWRFQVSNKYISQDIESELLEYALQNNKFSY